MKLSLDTLGPHGRTDEGREHILVRLSDIAPARFRQRRGAIRRKRLKGRLLKTLAVVGWIAGLAAVATLISAELFGVR